MSQILSLQISYPPNFCSFQEPAMSATWAMKFSILSTGYFSVFLTCFARKLLWQEKTKLGVLALFAMVQSLLYLDYIAKLQWFVDDGVTAKCLVIIGFTAINSFLLVQKPIKEKFIELFPLNKKSFVVFLKYLILYFGATRPVWGRSIDKH